MNDTFILASGKSLLRITEEEKEYVQNSSLSISFNKYLLFYDKIGIVPDYHYHLDAFDKSGIYLFQKTIEKVLSDSKLSNVHFLVGPVLAQLLMKHQIKLNYSILDLHPKVGSGWNPNFDEIGWTSVPENNLFHFKGSMTSVINYASALKPTNTIKLLGADMDNAEYFFHDEFENDSNFHDWTYELMKESGEHSSNLIEVGGHKQEECIPWIVEQVKKKKGNLVTCNKNSYYAKNKFLEFKEIIS